MPGADGAPGARGAPGALGADGAPGGRGADGGAGALGGALGAAGALGFEEGAVGVGGTVVTVVGFAFVSEVLGVEFSVSLAGISDTGFADVL